MVLCLPCIGAGQSQPQEPGAAAIIADLLNHQPGFNGGSFSCGWGYPEALESRKVADSLAKLGDSAVPDIERALDSIEQEGERSRFAPIASWLAYSYVKIKGPSAYPRLRTMIGDSKLDFLQYALSNCLSAAFGLTSYVDSSSLRPDTPVIGCRAQEPRDALNQVILAWERNNRARLQANLGPNARAALKSLSKGSGWAAMRADFSRGTSKGIVAVGYRFSGSGWWVDSEWPVEEGTRSRLAGASGEFDADTLFKDGSGGVCGDRRVKFKGIPFEHTFLVRYVVDNSDLGDLLRMVASCATRTVSAP